MYPRMWAANTTKLYLAIIKKRHRDKCIRLFSLLDPKFIKATTAELSDQNRTDFPVQYWRWPHSAADRTTGIISRTEICEASMPAGHCNWNHLIPWNAPQPQLPDALIVTSNGGFALWKRTSIEVPFQCAANVDHQRMSDLAETLSLTKLSRLLAMC